MRSFGFLRRLVIKFKIISMLLLTSVVFAHEKPLKQINYKVIRNNALIGFINVSCITKNDSIIYYLDGHINVNFLVRFDIKGRETSIFKDNTLVYSSVFRKINDKVKSKYKVIYKDRQYHEEGAKALIPLDLNRIQNNLVSLYFNEPKKINRVYSAYLKEVVDVQFMGNGKYKVDLSNGKYNIFHYNHGKCVMIEVYSRFFSVTLIPDS